MLPLRARLAALILARLIAPSGLRRSRACPVAPLSFGIAESHRLTSLVVLYTVTEQYSYIRRERQSLGPGEGPRGFTRSARPNLSNSWD